MMTIHTWQDNMTLRLWLETFTIEMIHTRAHAFKNVSPFVNKIFNFKEMCFKDTHTYQLSQMWLFAWSDPCLVSGVDIGLLSWLWWVDLLVGMAPAARLGGRGGVASCGIATNHHWPTQCHTSSTFLQWRQGSILSILEFLQLFLLFLLLLCFSVGYKTHGSEQLGELVVKVTNDDCSNDTFIF